MSGGGFGLNSFAGGLADGIMSAATGGQGPPGGGGVSDSPGSAGAAVDTLSGGADANSGSGVINLGTGVVNAWEKSSTGEYFVRTYGAERYSLELVREATGAVPQSDGWGIRFPNIQFGFDSPVGGGQGNIPFLNPEQGITSQRRGPSANFPIGIGVISVRPAGDVGSGTGFLIGSVSTLAGGFSVALNVNDGSSRWTWLWASVNFPVGPGVNFYIRPAVPIDDSLKFSGVP
jgi:hypothetical protein